HARRPVGAEVAPADLAKRVLRVEAPEPSAHPVRRPREPDAPSLARGEAHEPAKRERLEVRAPALAEMLPERLRAGQLLDPARELLARQRLRVERDLDRGGELVGLGPRIAVVRKGAEPGEPEAELGGGQDVQRPAHRPQLHERALLPERVRERIGLEPLDAGPEAQLRRGHQLRVQPADSPDHVDELARSRPLDEPVAPEAPGKRLVARDLEHRALPYQRASMVRSGAQQAHARPGPYDGVPAPARRAAVPSLREHRRGT